MINFEQKDLAKIFNDVGNEMGINISDYAEDIEMGIGMMGERFNLPESGGLVECVQGFASFDDAENKLTSVANEFAKMGASLPADGKTLTDAAVSTINKIISHIKP